MNIPKKNFSSPWRDLTSVTIAGVLLLASGCGGSGGSSSSSDPSFPTPSLPAGAKEMTAGNALATATEAVDFLAVLSLVTSLKSETPTTVPQVVDLITDYVKNRHPGSGATAAQTEDLSTEICVDGGSAISDFEESATTASGEIEFDACNIGVGILIDGNLLFDSSENLTTQAYSFHFGGTLTISIAPETVTIVLNLTETGNAGTGTFSGTGSFSLNGIPGGGYLVTITQPWVGNFSDVSGGEIIIFGSNNTRLRITVTAINTATVDLDTGNGIFVPQPGTITIILF